MFYNILVNDATCLLLGPMSLDWLVHPFRKSDSSGPFLLLDAPCDGLRRVVVPVYERSFAVDRALFQCEEAGTVRRPHLLVGRVRSVPTNLLEVKGQQELREIEDEYGEEEVGWNGELKVEE